MAINRIKGITIEINGDATGLDKALKDVNASANKAAKDLKDIDRLLKLDPGNTELLAQKQRALQGELEATKDKLNTLKEAEKQVEQEFANGDIDQGAYDAFKREIIDTENELERLQKKVNESNVTLQSIADTGKAMKSVGDSVASVGSSMTKNLTVPIAGLGAAAIKVTADFDSAMSNVKAISGATGEDFDALRSKAREMGAETKFSATEAANAMQYMAMAGWDTNQMLDGISGIMNLAAASGEDLATTSDIVTDALTAFGLKAEDSSQFADLLAKTAASANTNVSMMGETFKYAAPVMGAMGYSAEDAALAIGLMGNAGIKASSAGTALRGMISRMAKPTDEVAAAMDRLGVSLYDEEGQMYSFYEVMEQMRDGFGEINMPVEEFEAQMEALNQALEDGSITEKKFEDAQEELILQTFGAEQAEKARAAAMLAGKNALSGMLAIVNASDEDFENLKKSIDESSGAAEDMAKIMQDNTSGQIEILMSQLQELAISMGDILIPVFRDLISFVQKVVDKFNSMDESSRTTIVKLLAIVAAVGPVITIVGKLTSAIGSVLALAPKLGAMASSIQSGIAFLVANPIAAIIAAVVALVALIATKGDEIQAILKKVDDFMQNIFAKDFKEIFGPVFGEIFNRFIGTFKGVWDGAMQYLNGIIDFIRGVFTGDWQRAWNGVKEIFSGVFNTFKTIAKAPLNAVLSLVNGCINGLNKLIDGLGNISFDIPSWVPGIGGRSFDISIPKIPNIPYLAKGGTIYDGSAIVGEAGAELLSVSNGAATVTPLTNGGGNNPLGELMPLLNQYLPYLAAGNNIVLDSGVLVGELAPGMNTELGRIASRGLYR